MPLSQQQEHLPSVHPPRPPTPVQRLQGPYRSAYHTVPQLHLGRNASLHCAQPLALQNRYVAAAPSRPQSVPWPSPDAPALTGTASGCPWPGWPRRCCPCRPGLSAAPRQGRWSRSIPGDQGRRVRPPAWVGCQPLQDLSFKVLRCSGAQMYSITLTRADVRGMRFTVCEDGATVGHEFQLRGCGSPRIRT